MSHFLDKIRSHVLARIEHMSVPEDVVVNPLDFCTIFQNKKSPVIISEVKFASPSRGVIYHGDLNHVQIAQQYMANGASGLSILTEPDYFKGDINFIRDIRAALPTSPILLKDFVLAPIQIQQARAYGANAVLLIVGFMEQSLLVDLYAFAVSLGLTPLVEVHDEEELDRAFMLQPKIIGVNNRNLKTLSIDLETSRRLIQRIPEDVFAVCESGIDTATEIDAMMAIGFDGFLIGSHMMQTMQPGEALEDLLKKDLNNAS